MYLILFISSGFGQTFTSTSGKINKIIDADLMNIRTCPDYVDSCIYVCSNGANNPCHPENLYNITIDTIGNGENTEGSRYRIFFPWEYNEMTADKFTITASWPCLSPTAVYASGSYVYWDVYGNDECPGTVQGSIWYGDDCEDGGGNIGSENCQELVGRFCFVPGDTLNWPEDSDQNISTDICDACWMSSPAWSDYDSMPFSDSLLSPGPCDMYDHCHHSASENILCGVGYMDNSDTTSVSINQNHVFIDYFITNYPNPFNPVTTLRYDLPKDSFVRITVYDMVGNIVKYLVNDQQAAGNRLVQWNATDNKGHLVPTGVYLYVLETKNFTKTKKMVLLK